MKIIHIIVGLNEGGAEGVLFKLIKYDKFACHIVISMMDLGKYGEKLEKIGVKVYILDMPQGSITYKGLKKLRVLIKKERPNVVQTWMYHADLVGGIIARLERVKRIYWGIRHSDLSVKANKKSTLIITRISALFSYFIPTKIISCSQVATINHLKIGYANRFIYIPNGYNIADIISDKKIDFKLKNKEAIIGMVGRFHPQKDHNNLFGALNILKTKNIKFHCILVGSDISNDNSSLLQLIENHGVFSNITLLGQRNDIPSIMNTLDLHILSSLGEAFPNVLAEAMACCTPCVSTDVGDASYIVGDTGWVVPSNNSILLAGAIEEALIERKNNPKKWKNRKESAKRRITDKFSIDKMVDSYQDAWKTHET